MDLLKLVESLEGGLIAITGGGGKTSLMYKLSEQLELAGKKVICTSTETLYPAPPECLFLNEEDPGNVKLEGNLMRALAASRSKDNPRRLVGYKPSDIDAMYKRGVADFVIVEVGPSAGCPIHAHNKGDIEYPALTSLVIGVVGMSAVGENMEDFWIKGMDRFTMLCEKSGEKVGKKTTACNIAEFLRHPEGFFLDAPDGVRRIVFLNQADAPGAHPASQEVVKMLENDLPAEAICIGAAFSGNEIIYEYIARS